MSSEDILVPVDLLKDFVTRIFIKAGVPPEDAEVEADVLCWANLHGVDSHGVHMVPWYLENIETGVMNPRPEIRVEKETAATVLIEADRALGPVVTVFAMNKVIDKATEVGIGWGLIRNTTHQGAIGYYSRLASERGMAGITFVCNPPNMAPWGARVAGIHNSPLAISVPAEQHQPIILDMATSVVAGGKIALAVDKKTTIPLGWALDADGNPTTDPLQAAVLLPAGGPKGSGLALLMECLSSVLADNPLLEPVLLGRESESEAFSKKERELSNRPVFMRRHIQNSVVIALNIDNFTDVQRYKEHIDHLIDGVKSLPKAEGVDEIMVPGEPEQRTARRRARLGIPIAQGTVSNLKAVADKLEVELPVGLLTSDSRRKSPTAGSAD